MAKVLHGSFNSDFDPLELRRARRCLCWILSAFEFQLLPCEAKGDVEGAQSAEQREAGGRERPELGALRRLRRWFPLGWPGGSFSRRCTGGQRRALRSRKCAARVQALRWQCLTRSAPSEAHLTHLMFDKTRQDSTRLVPARSKRGLDQAKEVPHLPRPKEHSSHATLAFFSFFLKVYFYFLRRLSSLSCSGDEGIPVALGSLLARAATRSGKKALLCEKMSFVQSFLSLFLVVFRAGFRFWW